MKVYAINGSPRKNNNTATLLKKALEGVKESVKDTEVEIEIINLYDLKYTGCISCFACKRLGGNSYGKCAVKDDIYEVLEKISQADGIIIGSPVYLFNITGQLQSFIERLLFPYAVYDENYSSIAPKKMPIAFIYTMNATAEQAEQGGFFTTSNTIETLLGRILTKPSVIYSYNTYQFDDYSKYKNDLFPEKEKAEYRKIHFPLDCQKAFELGVNLIK